MPNFFQATKTYLQAAELQFCFNPAKALVLYRKAGAFSCQEFNWSTDQGKRFQMLFCKRENYDGIVQRRD